MDARIPLFLTPLLLLVLLVWGTVPANAQMSSQADARVILIDSGFYSSLPRRKRDQAISDMRSDMRSFDEEYAATGATLVLGRDAAGSIRLIDTTGSGNPMAKSLRSGRLKDHLEDMERGRFDDLSPLDLNNIRPEMFDAVAKLGLLSRSRRGQQTVVDVHVFAAAWTIGTGLGTEDLMLTDQATECVIRRGPEVEVWPETVGVRFEFRTPDGIEYPSPSAMAAFIGSVTGFATDKHFIQTRGAASPLCPPRDGQIAVEYLDPRMANDLNCARDVKPRQTSMDISTRCIDLAPDRDPIGVGLERGPVAIVVRAEATTLVQPELSGTLVPNVDVFARIGGVQIRPGRTPPTGQTQAPGRLVFSGQGRCQKGEGGVVTLGSERGEVRSVVSRFYCVETELDLGMIELN